MNLQFKRYIVYCVIWGARILTFVETLGGEIMSTLWFWSKLSDLKILQQFVLASCLAGLVMLPMQLLVRRWGVCFIVVGSSIVVGRTGLKMAEGIAWEDVAGGEFVLLFTFAGWWCCILLIRWLLSHTTEPQSNESNGPRSN